MLRHTVINVGLMYDLGYQLWQVVDGRRIRSRYLKTVDSVRRAIFDQEREESENAMNEEGDDEDVDEDEDGEAATHVCDSLWGRKPVGME